MSTDASRENDAALSTAAQFKKRSETALEGTKLTLSDGLVVLAKKPKISKLLTGNILPANVAASLQKIELNDRSGMNLSEQYEVMKHIVKAALISPTIADFDKEPDYDKNEISIDDLEDEDFALIANWSYGGAGKVEQFRKK